MATMPPMPESIRKRLMRRLVLIYVAIVAAQAMAFIVIAAFLGFLVVNGVQALAHSSIPLQTRLTIATVAHVIELLAYILLALAVGFFGARELLRLLRAEIPPHLPVPTRTILIGSLTAGLIIALVNFTVFSGGPAIVPSNPSLNLPIFLIVQLVLIGLVWFGALRLLSTRRSRALCAPQKPAGTSLQQRA